MLDLPGRKPELHRLLSQPGLAGLLATENMSLWNYIAQSGEGPEELHAYTLNAIRDMCKMRAGRTWHIYRLAIVETVLT
jgi:hypothetical protein